MFNLKRTIHLFRNFVKFADDVFLTSNAKNKHTSPVHNCFCVYVDIKNQHVDIEFMNKITLC